MSYFAYPGMALWGVVPLLLAGAAVAWARQRQRALRTLGQPGTIRRLLPPGLEERRRWAAVCYVAGLVLWVSALAGPLLGSRLVEFKHRGLDIFIALDGSLSMQAEDLKP